MLCVPLEDRGRVLGVLKLYAGREGAFDAEDERIAGLLTQVIGTHLGLAVPAALGGREDYEQRLAKEVARATRYDRRLAVVRFAFDPAAAGRRAMRSRRDHRRARRRPAVPARPGEFAVLLPETDEAGAERMAARVAGCVRRRPAGLGRRRTGRRGAARPPCACRCRLAAIDFRRT